MWKTSVIFATIALVVCATGEENRLTALILDLRTQMKHLTAKVDGISSHVNHFENNVNETLHEFSHATQFVNQVNETLHEFKETLDGTVHDVASVKKGFTGTPFSSCTGEVITVTGTTIKYPATGNYRPNEKCSWLVKAGNDVKVSFTALDLEKATCSGEPCDYVEISQNGQIKKKWGGFSSPTDTLVLNGDFIVKFISDSSNQLKGFQMELEKNE